MSISPGSVVSGWRPSATSASLAYQSLQPSPIAAACSVSSAPAPVAVVIRRFDRPCVYSWKTIEASSPPLTSRKGDALGGGSVLLKNRYICITGDWPSGSVTMFALSRCRPSGSTPPLVVAPSSVCATSASPPAASKFPDAASKPIGAAARWSWKRLTDQKTCTAFWARFVSQLLPTPASHEHRCPASHAPKSLEPLKLSNG